MVTESAAYQTIISMGFSESAARDALHKHRGDLERALDSLLSPQSQNTDNISSGESEIREGYFSSQDRHQRCGHVIVSTDISQFTLANGRSACTCIALSGAGSGLKALREARASSRPPEEIFTSEFIQGALFTGIGIYERKKNMANDVEHMSVEEVFNSLPPFFADLNQIGQVRQGILLPPGVNGDNGLKATLIACQEGQGSNRNEWMAVVMTKTPETVTIFVPPTSVVDDTKGQQKFFLLDSHPRPHIFDYTGGSYAMICDSQEDLLKALEKVFPLTDLGEDVGEIMAMMYNSFDMYAFHL